MIGCPSFVTCWMSQLWKLLHIKFRFAHGTISQCQQHTKHGTISQCQATHKTNVLYKEICRELYLDIKFNKINSISGSLIERSNGVFSDGGPPCSYCPSLTWCSIVFPTATMSNDQHFWIKYTRSWSCSQNTSWIQKFLYPKPFPIPWVHLNYFASGRKGKKRKPRVSKIVDKGTGNPELLDAYLSVGFQNQPVWPMLKNLLKNLTPALEVF